MRDRLPSDQQIDAARRGTESLRAGGFNRSQGQGPSGIFPGDATPSHNKTPNFSPPSPDISPQKDLCTSCSASLDADGNVQHLPGCSVLVKKMKDMQIKLLAQSIRSGKQLRRIILDAQPRMRRQVYDLITPHITRFPVPTYERLMGGPRAR